MFEIPITTSSIIGIILGVFISTSILLAWFHSTLLIHVLQFVYKITSWSLLTGVDDVHMRLDLDDWFIFNKRIPVLLTTLLTCPVCLSFHTAFWTSCALCLLGFFPIIFVPILTFTYPIISHKLLK